MFTINRTIVSEAYGSHRARFPNTTRRPKGQPTDTSRSQQPQSHHHQKIRKYTSTDHKIDSDLPPKLKTQNSPIVRYHQPKIKEATAQQNAPPLQSMAGFDRQNDHA